MAQRFPVSVKGVVFVGGRVALLKNEREEWELPGGKLELGEAPEACVAREVEEELGLRVRVGPLLDTWQYHIAPGADVLIVTYGCHVETEGQPRVSHEHSALGLFAPAEVDGLPMPEGYRRSVRAWAAHPDGPPRSWMPRGDWDALVRGEGCPLCRDLAGDAAPNEFRHVVADLSVSTLWLMRSQNVPGYCVVVARRHAREPHELEPGERAAFFEDMVRAGRALEEAFGAVKVNYEVLGNAVPHLHAHVKPRLYGDAAPGQSIHANARVVHLSDAEYAQRVRLIRAALGLRDD